MKTVKEFQQKYEFLPPFMRDFHDQKLLFKFINETVARSKAKDFDSMTQKLPDWISAQIYTVDYFLWIMARHGYELQKTRKQVSGCDDIVQELKIYRQYLDRQLAEGIKLMMNAEQGAAPDENRRAA